MVIGMEQAAEALRAGGALIFPTDTVWGIGVAVEHAKGTWELSQAKGRAPEKPIAWLVGDKSALDTYGMDVPDYACRLAGAFWPGPLTLVVWASREVPPAYIAADGTVGLRMPDSKCVLALARAAGSPLATTSANFAGQPARPSSEPPDLQFAESCDVPVLDARVKGGAGGAASAVVDCSGCEPRLLRAGTISASEMQGACGVPFLRTRPR